MLNLLLHTDDVGHIQGTGATVREPACREKGPLLDEERLTLLGDFSGWRSGGLED